MNTAASKKRNQLTAAVTYKLCNLISTLNQAGGITVDSSWTGLAEYCAKMLDQEITANNVKGAFEILELHLPQAPKSKEQQLEDRIQVLEGMVKYMCTNLGLTSPY